MKVSFDKFPVDLVLCLIWSALLIPIVIFNIEEPIRIILGVPFILFIPGYVLVFALFPFKRPGGGVTVVERIGLSLGMSVAIVPLFGLGLNFSPWGIRLEPMLLVLSLFIFGVGLVALYRWFATAPEERFCVSFDVSFPSFENRFDKIVTITFENRFDKRVTIILGVLIIIAVTLTIYVIVVPKIGEKFTEFYVLGMNGTADQYPQNLSVGENASVILGITNHEYRTINYTIVVWLVNETTSFNAPGNNNETVVNHMWFVDEITVSLNHTPVNLETLEEPQWEYNYSFSLLQRGSSFKLEFLLFTTPTEHYTLNEDYKDTADQLIKSAYRDLHLWVTIT